MPHTPTPRKDHHAAFAALRALLAKHAQDLIVHADTPTNYTLITPSIGPNRQPIWFAYLAIKKSAVTFHLVPLYYNPKLNALIPAELRPHLKGKTCFHFQRPDPALFAQLDTLTATARDHFAKHGFLTPGPVSPDRLTTSLRAAGVDTAALAMRRAATAKSAAKKRAATLKRKSRAT